jgi:hypothetical protein
MAEVNLSNPIFKEDCMNKLSLQILFSIAFGLSTFQANAQFGTFLKDLKDLADKAEKQLAAPVAPAQNSAPAPTATLPSKTETTNAYPPELQGKYAYAEGNLAELCANNPAIVINPTARYDDTDTECKAIKVSGANGVLTASEKCSREGRSRTQSVVFEIKANALTVKDAGNTFTLRKCPGSPQANTAPASAAVIQKCNVNPGQAGVTTFLDDKLKRKGRSVRDFDTDTFVVEKKITVGKDEILVGKLLNGDGSVAEAKSFAYAEEWTCK